MRVEGRRVDVLVEVGGEGLRRGVPVGAVRLDSRRGAVGRRCRLVILVQLSQGRLKGRICNFFCNFTMDDI